VAQYELNVLDYWLIVKKRKGTILLSMALVIVFTLALTQYLTPPPVYEASARVKFERSSTFAAVLLESLATQSGFDLNTEMEVIRSFPVVERAAKELKVVPAGLPPDQARSSEYLGTIYKLQQAIKTSIEGASNIIRISVTSETAEMAQRFANAVAEAYRMENIRTRNKSVSDSRRFVEEQLVAHETALKQAEEALRDFKEREGQVFLNEEAKAALESFTTLEAEYDKILRLRDETVKQIEILQRPSDGRPAERIFTDEPTALLSVLNSKLTDLLQERDNLLINYTAEHLLVKELDRKIRNVKNEIVRVLESKLKTLTGREATLREQIDTYRKRYFNFPKAAIQLSRLERDVAVSADLYAKLKVKHQELLIKTAERIEEVSIIEPAILPTSPINQPNNQMNFFVAVVMGGFLGVVLAFARESFDTSIGTIEGVEEFLQVPVLGVIPRFNEKEQIEAAAVELPPDTKPETVALFSKLVCLYDEKSVISEGFRSLRTNIQFASSERQAKTFLFTSAGLGEGKTTTIVNLALTIAQDGKRVLLVDADLRRPFVHTRLGLERSPGLAEVLVGGLPWREAVKTVTDLMIGLLGVDRIVNTPGIDLLNVMTSGSIPHNPAEFINSQKFVEVLREMREEYDVVLFDTPPILPIADAVLMSSKVDGVVLVYQVGRIGRSALKRAKFLVDHAQGKVLGTVLTNVRAEITPEYGYYRYEYR
jgi:capsular exopolysaccharide synthesis family protein